MSYAAFDLREGIVELFDEASLMSARKAAFGELSARRARTRAEPRPRPRLSAEERKVRRRLTVNKYRAKARVRKAAEREAPEPIFWVGPPPDPRHVHACYICLGCGSRSSTHRCPG